METRELIREIIMWIIIGVPLLIGYSKNSIHIMAIGPFTGMAIYAVLAVKYHREHFSE